MANVKSIRAATDSTNERTASSLIPSPDVVDSLRQQTSGLLCMPQECRKRAIQRLSGILTRPRRNVAILLCFVQAFLIKHLLKTHGLIAFKSGGLSNVRRFVVSRKFGSKKSDRLCVVIFVNFFCLSRTAVILALSIDQPAPLPSFRPPDATFFRSLSLPPSLAIGAIKILPI